MLQEIIVDYWILTYSEVECPKKIFKVKEYKSERPLLAVKHYNIGYVPASSTTLRKGQFLSNIVCQQRGTKPA